MPRPSIQLLAEAPAVAADLPASVPLSARVMPDSATAPRLMTGRHPRAVGSYGQAAADWALARPKLHLRPLSALRWWQLLVLDRALEHDADGRLVWQTVVVSAPRQSGKSVAERVLCAWRLHHAGLFGEPQDVLHVAHKLPAAREVWRPAARWTVEDPARGMVRWASGEERIELPDGGRWMVQAANDGAGVSFSLSMVLVDEAWRVPRRVVDGALVPTMAESEQPQLWLVSTAGDSDSDLMQSYRSLALGNLEPAEQDSLLLLEWSAPPDSELDIDDPAVWRSASPHWDTRRHDRVTKARGETDEWQFRQQWLNQWVPALSAPLFDASTWRANIHLGPLPDGALAFGADVAADRTSATIVSYSAGVAEVVAREDGAGWVAGRLAELAARWRPLGIGLDGTGPAATVADQLRDTDAGPLLVVANGRDLATASAQAFDAIAEGRLRGRNHDALNAAVTTATRRPYGQAWAFARTATSVPLLAMTLARWAAEHATETVEASAIW